MVQIKLGETKKEPAKDTVVDVDNAEKETKAKTVPVGTYRIIRRTNTTQVGWFPVFSFFVILVSSFCLLKQVCDLKQENLMLRRQLELESQKDAILKQVVMDAAVSEETFMRTGFKMNNDLNVIYTAPIQDPSNLLDINLSLLWSSPEITRCDMAMVARMLFQEIYKHGQLIYEEKELKEFIKEGNEKGEWSVAEQVELVEKLNEVADLKKELDVDVDSSEEAPTEWDSFESVESFEDSSSEEVEILEN